MLTFLRKQGHNYWSQFSPLLGDSTVASYSHPPAKSVLLKRLPTNQGHKPGWILAMVEGSAAY